jgi:hypothetical protein
LENTLHVNISTREQRLDLLKEFNNSMSLKLGCEREQILTKKNNRPWKCVPKYLS